VRYALQSAFSVSHFVPDDAQRLGYFEWQGKANAFGQQLVSVVVPFELFRRTNQSTIGYELQTLVMWLEEEWFARRTQSPAACADAGAGRRLSAHCAKPAAGVTSKWRSGPGIVNTLRAMVREASRCARQALRGHLPHLAVVFARRRPPVPCWGGPAAAGGRTGAGGELPCRADGQWVCCRLLRERSIVHAPSRPMTIACVLAEERSVGACGWGPRRRVDCMWR
jgi:hypothetical protein